MKLRILIALLLTSLLASCATPAPVPISTTTPIATIPFTETVALPSLTLTRTSTVTPEPSATLTSTPDLSAPYSDTLFTKKLSTLVLSPNDVPHLSPQVIDPNYPPLVQPTIQNLTKAIKNCEKDCVQVLWKSKKVAGSGDSQVTLVLIRMETAQKAAEQVVQSYTEFSQVASDVTFMDGDITYPDQLPANSKVSAKFKEPNIAIMFTASRGPVYLMITYDFQTEGDLNLDFDGVQNLAILQFSKLEAAGYPE